MLPVHLWRLTRLAAAASSQDLPRFSFDQHTCTCVHTSTCAVHAHDVHEASAALSITVQGRHVDKQTMRKLYTRPEGQRSRSGCSRTNRSIRHNTGHQQHDAPPTARRLVMINTVKSILAMLDALVVLASTAGVPSAQQWQGPVFVGVWPAASDGARCLGSGATSTWCLHLQGPRRLPARRPRAVCWHAVVTPVYGCTRCQRVALYVLPQVDTIERDECLQAVGCLAQGRQVLAAA
jgi:hypothetical protein